MKKKFNLICMLILHHGGKRRVSTRCGYLTQENS